MYKYIQLMSFIFIGYFINTVAPKVSSSSPSKIVKYKRDVPPEYANSTSPHCESFTVGDEAKQTLYSPGYPNHYPNNTDCVVVLKAPPGHLIQLDFRNYFNIELSDGCKFDYLEIRDGAHGFSNVKGTYCGQEFPPLITSTERFLWLHFKSDENIEYSGFIAVYEFIPRPSKLNPEEEVCVINATGHEGVINRTDIGQSRINQSIERNVSLDCMWIIRVKEGWVIQLLFLDFKLHKPNDCDMNFLDVFSEKTDLNSRLKSFCGSMADSIASKNNVMHIRFFANPVAINSAFQILFTALRYKKKGEFCTDDEYDCEDETCISKELKCNGQVNCRFRWDEDDDICHKKVIAQSEHVLIIIIVFGLILGGMLTAFIVNCLRKLIRDHKIIREHIRQSKESKLDELGRHSTKISRENLANIKINPRKKDSPNNVLDEISQRYYREQIAMQMEPLSTRVDIKRDNNTRNQELKDILETRQNSEEEMDDLKSGMCDMACQTRESLFQPVFKNKVAQSPTNPPRFSTFGYDTIQQPQPQVHQQHVKTPKHQINRNKKTVATTIEMEDGTNFNNHQQEQQQQQQQQQPIKKHVKTEESRLVLDIRNSAPDVIIMTSSH